MKGKQAIPADTVQAPIKATVHPRAAARKVLRGQDLTGQVAIVTGGYSGVGLEAARALAEAGAAVIVPARSPEKARDALQHIPNVELEVLDLMAPHSIDAFARRFLSSGRPLHMLINSAGIMASPLLRDERGYESQFATNHLGHFQLTARLWPALLKAKQARVVSVSSRAHRLGAVRFDDPNFESSGYDKWKAYAQSKTANILFAVHLDRMARDFGVRAFAVHPGLIPTTGIGRFGRKQNGSVFSDIIHRSFMNAMNKLNVLKWLNNLTKRERAEKFKSMQQGASTPVWCAASSDLSGLGGVYCEDNNIAEAVPGDSPLGYGVRPWATDPEAAHRLWELSERMAGVKFEVSNVPH